MAEPGDRILLVTQSPASDLDDVPLRVRRVLGSARLVVAADGVRARAMLDCWSVPAPVVSLAQGAAALAALQAGPAALLTEGGSACPSAPAREFIGAALGQGWAVAAVPGPVLPVTALIASGLPADSFVYLGCLPADPARRQRLLAGAAQERRTQVAMSEAVPVDVLLDELYSALGSRPVAAVRSSRGGSDATWRGMLGQERAAWPDDPLAPPCAVVVGGHCAARAAWEEGRLRSAIRTRLEQGMDAKAIGRLLAAESGWSRRQIYRLAVEAGAPHGQATA